jgi:hypothetical protein
LALRNRLNASWTSAGVQGRVVSLFVEALDFAGALGLVEALEVEGLEVEALELALPIFFAGFDRRAGFGFDPGFFFEGSLRVIFGMIRVY